MTVTQRLGAGISWLLLCVLGGYLVWLSFSQEYWRLLNPRFSPLTLAAGAALAAVVVAARPDRGGSSPARGAWLTLVVFFALALTAHRAPDPMAELLGPGPVMPDPFSGGMDAGPSRVEVEGREYVALNVAELLALQDLGGTQAGEGFVLQGMVLHTPELDQRSLVAVARLFITCCLADAVGVAHLVRVDDPEAFANGTWVRAAGRLQTPEKVPAGAQVRVPGALAGRTGERFVLVAEQIETMPPTRLPYIFEVRSEEPFAF